VRTVVTAAAAAAVLGAAIGIAVAAAGGTLHRAQTTVAVDVSGVPGGGRTQAGGGLVVPTVAELATGTLVVENLASTLHLSPSTVRARLHASVVRGTALVRLRYDDPSAVRALADVQQAAVALTSIVASQFASGRQRLSIAVVDPPRPAAAPGKPYGRDALDGALLGALLAAGLAEAVTRRRGAQATPRARPKRLPRRATSEPKPKSQPGLGPETAPEPVAEAAPAAPPAPTPTPQPPAPAVPGELTQGAWSLAELERRVRAADARESQRAEWLAYLEALRPAAENGTLGPTYDSVVFEIFGDLV
jgi:hypothetical protein